VEQIYPNHELAAILFYPIVSIKRSQKYMGIIEGIRRRIAGADDTEGDYECRDCGARYEVRRQVCPACECFRIERTDW
jgi:hypothetical protein